MYICIYVDSLLVALILKAGFFRARFFRRGWIVLVLGRFGPPKDVEGFRRMSKDVEGCRRISKDFEGFRRISKGFSKVFSKDFEGFRRISMDFEGFRRISTDFEGCRRISRDFEGFRKVFDGFRRILTSKKLPKAQNLIRNCYSEAFEGFRRLSKALGCEILCFLGIFGDPKINT